MNIQKIERRQNGQQGYQFEIFGAIAPSEIVKIKDVVAAHLGRGDSITHFDATGEALYSPECGEDVPDDDFMTAAFPRKDSQGNTLSLWIEIDNDDCLLDPKGWIEA